MKFRVLDKTSYTNAEHNRKNFGMSYANDYYNVEVDCENIIYSDGDKKIICIGNVLVIPKNNGSILSDIEKNIVLEKLLSNFDINIIHSTLQGIFVLIYIDKKIIKIATDKFSRKDIYYSKNDCSVEIASDMSLLSSYENKGGFNQNALSHMLTYYGNRPAKKETIYNSINRLGVLESIQLNHNDFNIERYIFKPKTTRKFTVKDNERYSEMFLQAIAEGGSSEGNIIYLSSGWDSTSILAGLVKVYGANKVRAVIGRMKYSDRSGVCNAIEVQKAEKFADYYGVKLDIADLDYATEGRKMIDNALPVMQKHGFYNIAGVNHARLAASAKEIMGDREQVIFFGEISDGAHNFGFSQYATIFHPSHEFREYADKMASYLFGPTFLRRIIAGDYKSDPIYKLFYSDIDFIVNTAMKDEKAIKKNLFIDFYLRNGRRPFWSGENNKMLTKKGLKEYTDFHYNQYLSICESSDADTLYSYFLHLYNSFHWQGSTVITWPTMAAEYGMKICSPFLDNNIQDFLSEMPESWGRGLDLKNTKYPLKWMLENKLDYPMEFQEGAHAYTYDIDPSFNHNEEILCHSSLSESVKRIFTDYSFEEILSEKWFDLQYISNLTRKYINKDNLSVVELNEIFALYLLAKLELEESNI